jgi:flagellar basal-body rod protein FlgB
MEQAMEPIQIFQLASKQAQWLSVRESVVSGNIANVNTPGYKLKDVTPFAEVMRETGSSTAGKQLSMISTNPAHFGKTDAASSEIYETDDSSIKITSNGNNVAIADEMMKSSEIRQDYDLNTGLVKSLNRMMLMAVRR